MYSHVSGARTFLLQPTLFRSFRTLVISYPRSFLLQSTRLHTRTLTRLQTRLLTHILTRLLSRTLARILTRLQTRLQTYSLNKSHTPACRF